MEVENGERRTGTEGVTGRIQGLLPARSERGQLRCERPVSFVFRFAWPYGACFFFFCWRLFVFFLFFWFFFVFSVFSIEFRRRCGAHWTAGVLLGRYVSHPRAGRGPRVRQPLCAAICPRSDPNCSFKIRLTASGSAKGNWQATRGFRMTPGGVERSAGHTARKIASRGRRGCH